MKYPIPESEDIEWQQEMLREIDRSLDEVADFFEVQPEVEELITDARARVASLRAYSGY